MGKDIVYFPARTDMKEDCDDRDRYLQVIIRKVNNSRTSIQLIFDAEKLVRPKKKYGSNVTIIDYVAFPGEVIQYPGNEDKSANEVRMDWRWSYYSKCYNKVKEELDKLCKA